LHLRHIHLWRLYRLRPWAPAGGEGEAQRLLSSFLGARAAGYSRNMSSPVTAWDGCSRLSPYLAWGCISLRNVYQRTQAAADVLRAAKGAAAKRGSGKAAGKAATGAGSAPSASGGRAAAGKAAPGGAKRQRTSKQAAAAADGGTAGEVEVVDLTADSDGGAAQPAEEEGEAADGGAPGGGGVGLKDLAAFTARLRWRSHFMQKLEDQGGLVAANMCTAYDGARDEQAPNPALFKAWCEVGRRGAGAAAAPCSSGGGIGRMPKPATRLGHAAPALPRHAPPARLRVPSLPLRAHQPSVAPVWHTSSPCSAHSSLLPGMHRLPDGGRRAALLPGHRLVQLPHAGHGVLVRRLPPLAALAVHS
jgi:hypothetical protein